MVESICPSCRAGNSPANQFCGQCGAKLKTGGLIPRNQNSITIGNTQLPMQQVKQVGISLAVGLATLLADAALNWFRRRLDSDEPFRRTKKQETAVASVSGEPTQIVPVPIEPEPRKETITIVQERIVEVHRWGRPMQRFVERMAWKKEN